jgi:hypothetical protein
VSVWLSVYLSLYLSLSLFSSPSPSHVQLHLEAHPHLDLYPSVHPSIKLKGRKQLCEASSTSEKAQLQNEEILRDFLKNPKWTTSKMRQFCPFHVSKVWRLPRKSAASHAKSS